MRQKPFFVLHLNFGAKFRSESEIELLSLAKLCETSPISKVVIGLDR